MTTIRQLIAHLEQHAPPAYQADYDNSGLLVGNAHAEISGVLVTLDCLESTVAEARARGCNLIVAHHPIVFRGLKRLTGKNYVERVVMQAIKHDIAIYAIHTNLDSVLYQGVNSEITTRLGLQNVQILAPQRQLLTHLTTFAPVEAAQNVLNALYAVGAGTIGKYEHCSFQTVGAGSFRPLEGANPHIGQVGSDTSVAEMRLEVIFPSHLTAAILSALHAAHPYETVAHYLTQLENEHPEVGAGAIGTLPEPMEAMDFLQLLKRQLPTEVVRHTALLGKKIQKVAVCGGSGSFLLGDALRRAADIFVTSDFKYHEFFDADGRIIIADIGHFESEQFTIDLLVTLIEKKCEKSLVFSTKICTNPVNYL